MYQSNLRQLNQVCIVCPSPSMYSFFICLSSSLSLILPQFCFYLSVAIIICYCLTAAHTFIILVVVVVFKLVVVVVYRYYHHQQHHHHHTLSTILNYTCQMSTHIISQQHLAEYHCCFHHQITRKPNITDILHIIAVVVIIAMYIHK